MNLVPLPQYLTITLDHFSNNILALRWRESMQVRVEPLQAQEARLLLPADRTE